MRVRRRIGSHHPHAAPDSVCTPRFCALRRGALLTVEHDLSPDELCDELAVLLAEQLVDTGALHGQYEFELVFTGVVRTTVDGAVPSWLRFYRNSLRMLETGVTAFAPIHQRAAALARGRRLVDLGSCFGFFPLRMSALGIDVTATDLSGPTMELLDRVSDRCAGRCRRSAPTREGAVAGPGRRHRDGRAPDRAPDPGCRRRCARRGAAARAPPGGGRCPVRGRTARVYGHIQRFDIVALRAWPSRLRQRHPGLRAGVHEYHGGWLILDRLG